MYNRNDHKSRYYVHDRYVNVSVELHNDTKEYKERTREQLLQQLHSQQ